MPKLIQRVLLLACAFTLGLGVLGPLQAQTLQIDALKANYLNGFVDFLRWDGELNKNSATIGVLGSQQLVNHLQKIAQRKENGRDLNIKGFTSASELSKIDILFVAKGAETEWDAIRSFSLENQVLLVGEQEGFIHRGGSIEFTVRKNRLRFIISPENANRCGIDVSSKLIELALEGKG